MKTLILIALSLSAIYCAAMYLRLVYQGFKGSWSTEQDALERYTFHLGLCFILAVGFMGLML